MYLTFDFNTKYNAHCTINNTQFTKLLFVSCLARDTSSPAPDAAAGEAKREKSTNIQTMLRNTLTSFLLYKIIRLERRKLHERFTSTFVSCPCRRHIRRHIELRRRRIEEVKWKSNDRSVERRHSNVAVINAICAFSNGKKENCPLPLRQRPMNPTCIAAQLLSSVTYRLLRMMHSEIHILNFHVLPNVRTFALFTLMAISQWEKSHI